MTQFYAKPKKMVEIFKTNVEQKKQSKMLIKQLLCSFPECKINFDLNDCDKVLRIEGENIPFQQIIEILNLSGFQCQILN